MSYLTGAELGRHILRNVVLIDRPGSQEHGAGLIVGRDEQGLLAVTAEHVVQVKRPSGLGGVGLNSGGVALADSVRVRFCSEELAGIEVLGTPIRVEDSGVRDIALVRLPTTLKFAVNTQVLADVPRLIKGEEAWVAGREGECVVGGSNGQIKDLGSKATIDDPGNDKDRIQAYLPGSNASTSGATLLTGRGAVGILQTLASGQNLVRATDLGAIRRASEATLKASWLLNRSGNLPPSLPDAARREVSEALNRYVFDAKTARRTLSRERLNSGELSGVIGSYNTAINRFMDVKSKHDGALQRYWEPVTLERYQSTRATLLSVHQVFLALTEEGLVNSMYRSDEVPSVVRERMSALNGQIDQLQSEIDSLLTAIAAEPRDRFAQTTN